MQVQVAEGKRQAKPVTTYDSYGVNLPKEKQLHMLSQTLFASNIPTTFPQQSPRISLSIWAFFSAMAWENMVKLSSA